MTVDERPEHAVAHGAGRRMSRTEARTRLKSRYRRQDLARSPLGGRVLCGDAALLDEEHPEAYQPIEPVVAALGRPAPRAGWPRWFPVMTVKL
ncbi:MAG TPA: RtcB family protein [Myxococcaceae bacterium]|nr:RtcB family protein [Myxococcaceae bacterium]